MTVQQFKEKYPHYSHLEGNELWDAMENAYLYEHKDDKPKDITDWMGNKVKEGDEICFITVKEINYFSNMRIMIPNGKGEFTIIENDKEAEPDKDCWIKSAYKKVFLQKGLQLYLQKRVNLPLIYI